MKFWHIMRYSIFFFLCAMTLNACIKRTTAENAIEGYLKALVAKNVTKAVNYSCAAWEEQALAEGAAFEGVTVKLEGLTCKTETEQRLQTATVSCAGKFVYSYAGGEDMEIGLEGRLFQATYEDNTWKMCGYP